MPSMEVDQVLLVQVSALVRAHPWFKVEVGNGGSASYYVEWSSWHHQAVALSKAIHQDTTHLLFVSQVVSLLEGVLTMTCTEAHCGQVILCDMLYSNPRVWEDRSILVERVERATEVLRLDPQGGHDCLLEMDRLVGR